MNNSPLTVESSVYQRYAAASQHVEPALCCPVSYAGDFLAKIPTEIIEKDYGCGDPSPFVRPGDTVVDLGSGAGKLCYILAQVVGATGRVIGVDCNQEMLQLARKYQTEMADRLGYANVDFRFGMIQDLALNLELLAEQFTARPIQSPGDWVASRAAEDELRRQAPLVESDSVDCVVSNCVLNLVRHQDRQQLFREIFRVLKPGGRAAISDIVADEDVPEQMQRDGQLWSGCLSGAFREDMFLNAFRDAGFHGIQIAKRQAEAWQTVAGIEFRSVTVIAYKGSRGTGYDLNQAVIYKGPYHQVVDDHGRVYQRGVRMAVSDRTFKALKREPYLGHFEFIEPRETVALLTARPFVEESRVRSARETKGADFGETSSGEAGCCDSGSGCC